MCKAEAGGEVTPVPDTSISITQDTLKQQDAPGDKDDVPGDEDDAPGVEDDVPGDEEDAPGDKEDV